MIKTADLKAQTKRELVDLAKNYGVAGWHSMRKDELVEAITKVQRRLRRKANAEAKANAGAKAKGEKPKNGRPSSKSDKLTAKNTKARETKSTSLQPATMAKADRKSPKPANLVKANSRPIPKQKPPRVSPKTARIRAQIRKRRESIQKNKDLSSGTLVGGSAVQNGAQRTRAEQPHKDRVILLVRDSYWLQASWEITQQSVQRAQSSMAEQWHTAVPTLRLMSVADVAKNRAETVERDITIHGGVDTWYIDVDEPPARFRVLVGYLAGNGDFHTICRSNIVETPRPGECERLDEHWRDIAEDYERIYSLSGGYDQQSGDLKDIFEERLHRPMPQKGDQGQVVGDSSLIRQSKLPFIVDAELIVYGKTSANASVMVANRPVKLQSDGSFTVRMELPDKRQVLPVTAETRDGLRQRTTVIAVERNTKVMEPVELEERL